MLEGDFQREYNLNLAECLWGEEKISARRFLTLATQLSANSTLARVLTKGWTTQDELLATVAELLDTGNRYTLLANGVKRYEMPEPIRIIRPGTTKGKRVATKEEVARLFGAGLRKRERR